MADWSEPRLSRLRWRLAQARLSIPDQRSRLLPVESSTLVLMLAAIVILTAAALGFTVARSAGNGRSSAGLDRRASAGIVRVSFPSAWRQRPPPATSPLGLSDEIALSPSRSSSEMLLIGRTVTANPQLLPKTLLASLPAVPAPQTVTLGGAKLYRYLNLTPRGQQAESVYALSTTAGTVLGVCIAPAVRTAFISGCERSLGTLALASGKALPPGPIPAYASTLNLAIKRLNGVRAGVGTQLRTASAGKAQARAAYALAAAHTQAASALSRLSAGPASTANSAVVTALRLTGAAYLALGHAASSQDPARYRAAGASLRQATSALTAAYSRLDVFGYSVS